MAPPRVPPTLFDQCCKRTSKVFHVGLKNCDQLWTPPKPPLTSPKPSPPVSPVKPDVAILPPKSADELKTEARIASEDALRAWLQQLPFGVQEAVVERVLAEMERQLRDDKDRKIILALINIDKIRPPDLFFGVYSLLATLQDTGVRRLHMTTDMWFAISEYDQVTNSNLLLNQVVTTLPRLRNLVDVNLAYIATDALCQVISRNLPQVESLVFDSSFISDAALKYLSGSHSSCWSTDGNHKLKKLSLQNCAKITEDAVWDLLQKLKDITSILYHNASSMAEILNKACQAMSEEEVKATSLKITHYTHPFPYRLTMFDNLINRIVSVCPHITVLNVVTEDPYMEMFSHMTNVRSATIELEDCFGLGFYSYLEKMGRRLEDLRISCSTDPTSTFLPEGGQSFELLNCALKLSRLFCSENLRVLHVSGCGLVSNFLMDKLSTVAACEYRGLRRLQTLIYLSYEDEPDVSNCDRRVLAESLQGCVNLECLSLEGNFSSFLTDAYLQREVLAFNPLSKLRIFDICGGTVNLTLSTAKRLANLPAIRELRVGSWRLEERDFKELVDFAQKKGWDLIISRVNRSPAT